MELFPRLFISRLPLRDIHGNDHNNNNFFSHPIVIDHLPTKLCSLPDCSLFFCNCFLSYNTSIIILHPRHSPHSKQSSSQTPACTLATLKSKHCDQKTDNHPPLVYTFSKSITQQLVLLHDVIFLALHHLFGSAPASIRLTNTSTSSCCSRCLSKWFLDGIYHSTGLSCLRLRWSPSLSQCQGLWS